MLSQGKKYLTCIGLLRVAEIQNLIQQLVNQDKVVLNILLVDLTKVTLHDFNHLGEEFEHQHRVHILLCDGTQPDVASFCVKEAGPGNVCDRGAHTLSCVDYIDAKSVARVFADIIAVNSRYEHFALVVVQKQTANHFDVTNRLQNANQKRFCYNFSKKVDLKKITGYSISFRDIRQSVSRNSDI